MARNRNIRKQRKDFADRPGNEATMGAQPSHEDIELRAYQLYQRRGAEPGREFQDWLDAERELRNPEYIEESSAPQEERQQ